MSTDFTGLIVPLPDLEPVVGQWRDRYDTTFADVPAHVTALFPWIPPDELTDADLAAVATLAREWQSFEVTFARFGRFGDEVHYLEPEPADGFHAITADLAAVWPEHQPYEGQFAEVVPHLTVAVGASPEQLAECRQAVEAALPVRTVARELLAVEVRDGRCRPLRRFGLAGRNL